MKKLKWNEDGVGYYSLGFNIEKVLVMHLHKRRHKLTQGGSFIGYFKELRDAKKCAQIIHKG